MKPNQLLTTLVLCVVAAVPSPAAVLYVDLNSATPTPPFTSWGTAATNIQDAVDAAVAGDQILVTNGVYQTGGKGDPFLSSSRVAVDKSVTIQSVNGPQVTAIQGAYGTRCVFLGNGAALAGFTLANGNLSFLAGGFGGGVAFRDSPSDAVVSNCVIVDCGAVVGGGAASATSFEGPPEVNGGTLINCTFANNRASGLPGFPIQGAFGGAVIRCRLIRCTLTGNGNSADSPGTIAGGGAYQSFLENCLLAGNTSMIPWAQGTGGGAAFSTLVNCTVVQNSARVGGGTYACWLTNCIVYDNSGDDHASDNFVAYSCTTPLPTNGVGNITNAPLFVDAATGNLRLQSNSPCINAANNDYVTSPVDLDGKERVVGGTVDMGAYEWVAVPTHYVSLASPNPTPPYLSWFTAATNIQDALDAASYGHRVLVTNGVYRGGGIVVHELGEDGGVTRVLVSGRRLESVNGPSVTSIVGNGARCAYLSGGGLLSGFTLTNGIAGHYVDNCGGGVYCSFEGDVVSNCVLTGNSAPAGGGGSFNGTLLNCTLQGNSANQGGGACRSTLSNCFLLDNQAGMYGGGVSGDSFSNCRLHHCSLARNQAYYAGGGAYEAEMVECTLVGNSAQYGGGAEYGVVSWSVISSNSAQYGGGATRANLDHCTVTDNSAQYDGGGVYSDSVRTSVLDNCLLRRNSASDGGGAYGGILRNCTIVTNQAREGAAAGAYGAALDNCIVYNNGVFNPLFWRFPNCRGCTLNFSCTTPLPSSGVGNITNAPLFTDLASGNLRLQSNSPCINAGSNALAPAGPDLDGNPRIAGGTVDMGAYEFRSPSSILSYVWAQQYGLPTDGSADFSDSDGDRLNNWQEWLAGTVPTDASSALRLLNPSNDVSGVTVTWQSVTNRTYLLERATNLGGAPSFSLLTSNLVGQAGTTSFTDTNATGPGPFFYRVGVQQ
jgi:hypothetical protein